MDAIEDEQPDWGAVRVCDREPLTNLQPYPGVGPAHNGYDHPTHEFDDAFGHI